MHLNIALTLCALCIAPALSFSCPSGGEIYWWGISWQGKEDVVTRHNKYRQMVLDGDVPGQPRGKNIAMVDFDNALADQAGRVSLQCEMKHLLATDSRWGWVGQNLFIQWNSQLSYDQDWNTAVDAWYSEYVSFIYPDSSLPDKATGHYTQLVWHNSSLIGCDFILYYDYGAPDYPYAKLYTCNYGPGGNIGGQAPYELA